MSTRELTKKEKRLVDLAKSGGTDKELVVLDAIDELETKFDDKTAEIQQSFKDTVKDIKDSAPDLNKILDSVRGKDSIVPGPKGEKGDSIKGDPGADYVLTEQDKKEIAATIKVPVVEKVIEKTEVIKEIPIVTNEIKEVAVADMAEDIRNKLELLSGDERLDKSAIKGLDETIDDKIKAIPEAKGGGGRQDNWHTGDVGTMHMLSVQAIAPVSPGIGDLWVEI